MSRPKKSVAKIRKSLISNFFQIRFGFVGVALIFLIVIVFSLLALSGRHENEHNYIVDTLGKQRLYSQTLTLQANQLGLLYEAIESQKQIRPISYLTEHINSIKQEMNITLRLFNSTLSEIKDGTFEFNSKKIKLYDTKSPNFQEKILSIDTAWLEFSSAIQIVLENTTNDVTFRNALILINENSNTVLGLTHDFSTMALAYFTDEHHKSQGRYIFLIAILILMCAWVLFGTYSYIIEPYTVFYRGLKALGSGKPEPLTDKKRNSHR